jgi:hypothetical protein
MEEERASKVITVLKIRALRLAAQKSYSPPYLKELG